jgi:CheY-like chemotaxis protein
MISGEMASHYHGKLEILAVEDGLDIQLLLKLFLRDYPCDIDMANNGEEAVQMYTRKKYDVVLMDMMMPVKDGYTATRDIREIEIDQQRNPAHIIALTANTLEEQIRLCERAGCNHFLHKPLSYQKLWEILNEIRIEPVQLVFLKEELQDLIPGYIVNRYHDLQQISILLEKGDFESIGLIGHKMKGSGSGYGMDTISRLGIKISAAATLGQTSIIADAANELDIYLTQLKIIYLGPL